MKIEKLSKYFKYALDYQCCLVFESWEDYVSYMKHGRESVEVLTNFFKNNLDYPHNEYMPNILTFVKNGKEAREFVKKAIEAGDEDYRSVQQYADKQHYEDGAYGILIGEWDGCNRFSFTKQGYLFDNTLYD